MRPAAAIALLCLSATPSAAFLGPVLHRPAVLLRPHAPLPAAAAQMMSLAVASTSIRPAPLHQNCVCASGMHGAMRSTLVMCEGDLESKLKNMQRKNQERGASVLGIVLLAIVWSFSVPPDIRRSVICTSQAEVDAGVGCVTASAVGQRIAEHYQTCGAASGVPCVQWDFSVDPAKLAATSYVLDQVRSLDASEVLGK